MEKADQGLYLGVLSAWIVIDARKVCIRNMSLNCKPAISSSEAKHTTRFASAGMSTRGRSTEYIAFGLGRVNATF